jgi:pyruvate ferredoxin oxidoreductase alpha subunit
MLIGAEVFDQAAEEFERFFGRKHRRLETYQTEDAEYILFGLGSMMGTVRDTVDELRSLGHKVGSAKIKCYRPFPIMEIRQVANHCKAIGVLDRDIAYGTGGILYQDIARALYNANTKAPLLNFVLGLGGRDITKNTIKSCFGKLIEQATSGQPTLENEVNWPDENRSLLRIWKVGV